MIYVVFGIKSGCIFLVKSFRNKSLAKEFMIFSKYEEKYKGIIFCLDEVELQE